MTPTITICPWCLKRGREVILIPRDNGKGDECPNCGWAGNKPPKPRPPFEGEEPLPVHLRPDCRGCGRKLKPEIETVWDYDEAGYHRVVARRFTGRYGLDNYFHSKECAYQFARIAAKRGYRIGF